MNFVIFSPAFIECQELLTLQHGGVITEQPQNFSQALAALIPFKNNLVEDAWFIGTEQTSIYQWFAAQQHHANSKLWCRAANEQWIELKSQATMSTAQLIAELSRENKANPVLSAAIAANEEAQQPAPTQNSNTEHQRLPELQAGGKLSAKEISDIINQVYLAYARNQSDAEKQLLESKEQIGDLAEPLKDLERAVRQGKKAHLMGEELHRKLQSGEEEEAVKDWIQSQKQLGYRVHRHLEIKFKKYKERQQSQKNKIAQRRQFSITMPQYQLEAGKHRHNLRSLPASPSWQIFIDETGTEFDQAALDLSLQNKSLGKVLALVLPQHNNLDKLQKPIHATDLTHQDIEQLLQKIMSSNVGVFGATVHDLTTYNWIGAIAKLTRWALLMLPITGETRVRVFIEQKAPYAKTEQLKALTETIENELKLLAPQKFAELHLSLEIMDKANPYNGYVDLIANAWGSPDPLKGQLLKRTLWRSHCLLEALDLDHIEKFYQRSSYQDNLTAADWFTLCTLASQEAEHSFLQHLSQQQQQKTAADPKLWRDYLQEVKNRIAHKNYTPASLRLALSWLDACRGEQQFPASLTLQLMSLQQAADNHVGLCDEEQSQHILQLAEQLRDEIPKEACEASLRVAISATHLFDFTKSEPFLHNWLEQPIAVPGLLNHGKLHSTLGQLAAFREDYAVAQEHFSKALTSFAKLSDPSQAQKEQQQTRTYQAIAWLDAGNHEADLAIPSLLGLDPNSLKGPSFNKLVKSGDSERFSHYLLLRWLVSQPQRAAMRQRYLELMPEWQYGEDHPWMLINAYRGWILAEYEQTEQAADFFQQAIDDCIQAESQLLQWMGAVLFALSRSLKLACNVEKEQSWPGYLPAHLLSELAKTQHNHERVHFLQKLLPFNFH